MRKQTKITSLVPSISTITFNPEHRLFFVDLLRVVKTGAESFLDRAPASCTEGAGLRHFLRLFFPELLYGIPDAAGQHDGTPAFRPLAFCNRAEVSSGDGFPDDDPKVVSGRVVKDPEDPGPEYASEDPPTSRSWHSVMLLLGIGLETIHAVWLQPHRNDANGHS